MKYVFSWQHVIYSSFHYSWQAKEANIAEEKRRSSIAKKYDRFEAVIIPVKAGSAVRDFAAEEHERALVRLPFEYKLVVSYCPDYCLLLSNEKSVVTDDVPLVTVYSRPASRDHS